VPADTKARVTFTLNRRDGLALPSLVLLGCRKAIGRAGVELPGRV